MSEKHSPGPWVWERVDAAYRRDEWTLKGPNALCGYWYDRPPNADARLIAAAPDQNA
jgi:hypothetical protein